MKRIAYMARIVFFISVGITIGSNAFGQSQHEGLTLLQVLPAITFLFALTTGILNLYIVNKLNKTEEKILTIIRGEFRNEISDLEKRMATTEQVGFVRTELKLMLEKIELKIDNAAKLQR